MKKFKFKKIDAFSTGPSRGNPAAGIYLNRVGDITDDEMQAIAGELKGFVNEVVYLFADEPVPFLRYFSSECEVDFCGHGTVAVMFDYIRNSTDLSTRNTIDIKVGGELLRVYNHIAGENSVFITAPPPSRLPVNIKNDALARALNVSSRCIDTRSPVDSINAGLNTLIVPITDLGKCLAVHPDYETLKNFCFENDIDIILVFSAEVSRDTNRFRTRVFAPRFGYLEDPATGSGNSAFGYYLLQRRTWDGGLMRIEQNDSREFPNIVQLHTVEENDERRVIFGGAGVVRIDGIYCLQ